VGCGGPRHGLSLGPTAEAVGFRLFSVRRSALPRRRYRTHTPIEPRCLRRGGELGPALATLVRLPRYRPDDGLDRVTGRTVLLFGRPPGIGHRCGSVFDRTNKKLSTSLYFRNGNLNASRSGRSDPLVEASITTAIAGAVSRAFETSNRQSVDPERAPARGRSLDPERPSPGSRRARRGHGGHFHCHDCGYEGDRDYVGALNVGRKSISGGKMEVANPVAYTAAGNHASFPSRPLDRSECARSAGVRSAADGKQDPASGRQTRLPRGRAADGGGGAEGGPTEITVRNTGWRCARGSITEYVLAGVAGEPRMLPNPTEN
jgi:hypothetical protein